MNELYQYIGDMKFPSHPRLEKALDRLTALLSDSGAEWLLGGSCGLWLQGVELPASPRDIDIYADLEDSDEVHEVLLSLATDAPVLDRSGIYVSKLSHYKVEEYAVELVGGFEVHARGIGYQVEVKNVFYPEAPPAADGLQLMPLAHELVFNLLRERPDRYMAIAKQIGKEPKRHIPLIRELVRRNRWSPDQASYLDRLVGTPGWFI
ncbi:hypothetical protein [Paenibacillus caui]|uniref:hypothetical protein n=1 Tax=Paenibacillus caui TaxID=2873927 RepID=UPI001CA98F94|nr:hypothetical protein [Paenibacillus caui]